MKNLDKLIELIPAATDKPEIIVLPQWYIEKNPSNLQFREDDKYGLVLWGRQVLILKE